MAETLSSSRSVAVVGLGRTSDVLSRIADQCGHRWTLSDLVSALGPRSFGLILLIFALPNALPVPIPILATLTSLPLIFFSAQLWLGNGVIWLPPAIARRTIAGDRLGSFLKRTIPWFQKLERAVKPRFLTLNSPTFQRFAGSLIFLLSCLIALPIPFSNLPLGIAMTTLALALVERDGWAMMAGRLLSLVASTFFGFLLTGYGWLLWQAAEGLG